MARTKTYLMSGGTLLCALGIGYFMQYGQGGPEPSTAPVAEIEVSEITLASSMPPASSGDAAADATTKATTATAAPSDACEIALDAQATAGALVDLALSAPCKPNERLTIHHNGMMFTEVTDDAGNLEVTVPALVESAMFVADFLDGSGAVASTAVPTVAFYERVVLQWRGDSGLQLHAREFTEAYFGEGHIWAKAKGDLGRTATGESGFLVRLGRSDSPEALVSEVYSFPSSATTRSGEIALTVEAEVTEANCNALVEAQTLERRGDSGLRVHDLTLDIPACDAVGDFLVLKNLVEDMTIAAN